MNLKDFGKVYFTDGACSGNPGPGGWGLLVIDQGGGQFVEIGGGEAQTTNNRMELMAVLRALEHFGAASSLERALIVLDSEYVRKGLMEWLAKWKKNAWKRSTGEAVLNQDIWERLDQQWLLHKKAIEFKIVKGHVGVPGNERVDEIAVAYSKNVGISLRSGVLESCEIDWMRIESHTASSSPKKSKSSKKGGYYLSYVEGVLLRHTTWAECEAVVKGTARAKFKKVSDAAEESQTLKGWGVS